MIVQVARTSNTARNSSKWRWRWPARWKQGEHLIVEAGTGVGKSLAYLIPSIFYAAARNKKAIISTHTINLQEQLIQKDLPMLARVLPVEVPIHHAQGAAQLFLHPAPGGKSAAGAAAFHLAGDGGVERIEEWSQKTEDGSLSDFEIEPAANVWQQVCSERGLCSPRHCAGGSPTSSRRAGGPVSIQQARSRMLAADVLVLNHTLFFTLLGSQEEEAGGGVLFKNDFVVFDEAHTVERVASPTSASASPAPRSVTTCSGCGIPTTQKGLLAVLRRGKVKLVEEALKEADQFFAAVEEACDTDCRGPRTRAGGRAAGANCGFAIAIWSRTPSPCPSSACARRSAP